jgi:RNA polymerase sigma-70 factor, ECF subfamily
MEGSVLTDSLASDETSLIRAAQAGDQEAFARLVQAYDQSVLRVALNVLRSEEDARDAYQEAFLRVYRNLDKFRFDCSFSTWLFRIVTNLCLDTLRRRKVRGEDRLRQQLPENEESSAFVDPLDKIAEHRAEGNPQRALLSKELRSHLEAALEELTPRERMVFELRHFQGMRLRGIGEMLGTSEEAAKNCLFRATQKMRSALEEFGR